MVIIYALALFVVLLLAWHFYIHKVLKDMLFTRFTQTPLVVTLLSVVSFVAALFIVWSISGISVIQYLQAIIASPKP